jgi:hypothetical protein
MGSADVPSDIGQRAAAATGRCQITPHWERAAQRPHVVVCSHSAIPRLLWSFSFFQWWRMPASWRSAMSTMYASRAGVYAVAASHDPEVIKKGATTAPSKSN